MLLTAFTSDGGAEGGGMRPGYLPLAASFRASSLDCCGGSCDEELCWWSAAAWVLMTCFARGDGSLGCFQAGISSGNGQ